MTRNERSRMEQDFGVAKGHSPRLYPGITGCSRGKKAFILPIPRSAHHSTRSEDRRNRTGAISGETDRIPSYSGRAVCNLVEIVRGHAAWLRVDDEASGCWERSIDNKDG